jgi:hypothetical protein
LKNVDLNMDAQDVRGRSLTPIFWKDAHGRSFLEGRSWTLIFERRLISGWTLMDSHFWKEAHFWMDARTLMDAHGRFSDAGRTFLDD